MSVSSTGGSPNPLGSSSQTSLWNNPQLLSAMLPGYNVSALAQAMQSELAVDAIPLDQMAQQVSGYQSQISAWQALQTDLQNLQTDAGNLAGQSLYDGISATSSNPADVTASGTGSGTSGTYQVAVSKLMQVEIDQSAGQSSDTSALGLSGTFSINGTSISVATTDSLQQIATSINDAGAGVSATVLPETTTNATTNTTTTSYVLSIAGSNGDALTWSDPNSILQSLGVLNSGTTTPTTQWQVAKNAEYSINGISEQSATNSDSTSIPGVTLNFLQAGTVTVTTSQDQSSVVSAFQQLATDYNGLLSDLNKYAGQGGLLEGNGALLGLSSSLYQALTGTVSTQPAGYQALDQIGVSISAPVGSPQDLKMSVDTSTLESALSQDPAAVASLLNSAEGVASQLQQQLDGYVGSSGTVPAQITQLNSEVSSLNQEINDPNSYTNQMIQEQNQQLQAEFSNMVTALMQSQAQGQQISSFLNLGSSSSSSSSSSGGTSSGG